MQLGTSVMHIEMRDSDERLMEDAGSTEERIFAGAWDRHAVRTMERVQLIFGNRGSQARSWHTYSENEGHITVADGYRERTLASPGVANSADYSGSASGGSFE